MPADPAVVAAYLAERTEQSAAASTVRTARAAIGAAHRDTGQVDPVPHDGVRRVLQGLARQAAGRGRGQAQGLTADDCAAILATAAIPRRTGRGVESETAAAERGAVDKAIVGLLFQGGLRRSEAAALRWADVQEATDGHGVLVYVRRSKTDQDGTAADVRYVKARRGAIGRELRVADANGRRPRTSASRCCSARSAASAAARALASGSTSTSNSCRTRQSGRPSPRRRPAGLLSQTFARESFKCTVRRSTSARVTGR